MGWKSEIVVAAFCFVVLQPRMLAAEEMWNCQVYPPEREVTVEEESGAEVVFVTRSKAHDANFYFHQRSWLPDSSVLFFKRSTERGWLLFGYIEETGELFLVQKPDQQMQVEPTVSRHADSLFVIRDRTLCEWTVSVHAAASVDTKSQVSVLEREIGPLPDDVAGFNGISETSDGKGVMIAYTRDVSPRSRVIRMDRGTGEIDEIMAIDDTIYHVQASWETPDLIMFSRVYSGTDARAPSDMPDGFYSRIHLADSSDREPWPVFPQMRGELVTHECWWVDDTFTFFSGIRKDGDSEEAHLKVLDTRTGVARILGAGAWWPGGKPEEVSRQNWWHGSGSPNGRFAAADNWHGDIGIFSAKSARTRILARGHRTYGIGEHPHVGWDSTGTKVIFCSNRRGNADVCIGYLPPDWIETDW
jgi:oligogalacturonide lyase